jgi:phosphoribosylformylglycinamidine (FGAM) synthase-like enzyme
LAQVYRQLGDKPADVRDVAQLKGFWDAMQAFTEVDQQQGVIFRRELRRDGMTNIFDTGEGGDQWAKSCARRWA